MVGRARAGLPYGRPASRGVARSVMVERGGVLLRRPTEATQAPPAMRRCGKMQLLRLVSCGGRLGLLAPDPCQRAFGSLGSHSGGSGWGGGPARGRRAGLARVTPRKGRGATRLCGAPPIRHGNCRDTFPSGEGAGLRALGRDSPTVAPLRPCLRAPPWSREAASSCGGRRRLLLLLRPCAVAEKCGFSDLSVGGTLGLLAPDPRQRAA